jgi:hypothetical protein
MIVSVLILVTSLALCLFYLQGTCRTILNREFQREYFRSVVNASRLEFLVVRDGINRPQGQVDYSEVRTALTCDYLALTYLLKNAVSVARKYSRQERLLMLYFRGLLMVLSVSHLLRLNEKRAILKLTSILQYFANTLGERVVQTATVSFTA